MKQKALEYLLVFSLGTILTGLGGFFSGYITVAKAAKEFFPAGLTRLEASIEAGSKHDAEVEQMLRDSKTMTGTAETTQSEMSGVMVSSRSRFKNQDVVSIENIDSAQHESTSARVIGSFSASGGDLILRVPPSIAAVLGFKDRARVEVRPQ